MLLKTPDRLRQTFLHDPQTSLGTAAHRGLRRGNSNVPSDVFQRTADSESDIQPDAEFFGQRPKLRQIVTRDIAKNALHERTIHASRYVVFADRKTKTDAPDILVRKNIDGYQITSESDCARIFRAQQLSEILRFDNPDGTRKAEASVLHNHKSTRNAFSVRCAD